VLDDDGENGNYSMVSVISQFDAVDQYGRTISVTNILPVVILLLLLFLLQYFMGRKILIYV